MRCHGCGSEMASVRARMGVPATGEIPGVEGDIFLDRCEACGRTWYDAGELAQLLGTGLEGLGFRCEDPFRLARCPACGAEASPEQSRCRFCGTSTAVTCPRCEEPLFRVRLAGFRLEHCLGCGGLGLDEGEATAIAACLGVPAVPASAAVPPPLPKPAGLTCTRCGRTGLALRETMCTADGLVCDGCGLKQSAEDSRSWQEQSDNADLTFVAVGGVLLAGLAAGARGRR